MEFLDIFVAGGAIMWPLLIISIAAVAFAVERFLAFRQFGVLSPGFTREVVDLVRKGRENEALRLSEETPGPVAASLAAILRSRHMPVEDMERRAKASSEEYFMRLERFLPALDTFTTLSPLLGLLGTILGMVKVFQQFTAASADEAAKARILAGVGESLYATAFGITIAVFCFAIYNYFTARQRAISIEAEQGSQRLLAHLHERTAPGGATVTNVTEEMLTRKRRGTRGTGGRAMKKTKIEIIPMIDTMFFLLVFFILSSVGIIKVEGFQVKLPAAENAEQGKPALVTVSINSQKQMQVNALSVPPGKEAGPYIRREVERQSGKSPRAFDKATVVISADEGVANGEVVGAIDQARALGISHFAIATAPGGDQSGG
jgi:biopolymer transport protein ExbB/TolQ/biopolymer transport protein ExbD